MSDLAFRSASQLARMIRRRELSSRELLDHLLERAQRSNPPLNAIVTWDVERAQARADAADAALARGAEVGPLHGLPVTIKDTFEVAGVRTTAGAPELSEHVPETSATAVRRLEAAGAIPFGKTNVPYLASDLQTYNEIFGTTNNPWDPARTPGGSSGGGAAAVATGLSAFELGSDIAGSIRRPAEWCGVYGHKPTWGIVPQRGHIPPPPGSQLDVDLNVVGPIARSAEDLALLLDTIAGPLPDTARGWRLELPAPRHRQLRDYRVGAWLHDADYPLDAAVRGPLESAIEALRRAGVAVEDYAHPEHAFAQAFVDFAHLLLPIMGLGIPDEVVASLASGSPDEIGRAALHNLRFRDWMSADERRRALMAHLDSLFERFDLLLMPVGPVAAIVHQQGEPGQRKISVNGEERPYHELLPWIAIASACQLPATVAPIARTPEGLPVGIQIVGRRYDDHSTIDFAARLADLLGGYEPPPGF